LTWASRRLEPNSPSKSLEDVSGLFFPASPATHLTNVFTYKCATVQGALQWLEDNQDKSLEEIQAAAPDDDEEEDETKAKIAELESGQSAKSLICNECGKRFRNHDLASYHATKTYDFMLLILLSLK
jgi:hypothetical protein